VAEVNMEQLLNCALCPNMCRCECPVLQTLGREAVAPAGKARLALNIKQENLAWSEDILEAVANCLGCRGCSTLCPFPELSLCDELLNTRLEAKKYGVSLVNSEPYLANLKKFSSPYGKRSEEAVAANKGAAVLFFAGCTTAANHPDSIGAVRFLLDKAGVSYQMIAEDCCGYPAEIWGDEALARQLAAENLRKMAESGATTLVTNCPECWQTFTLRYPQWEAELPLQIIDGPSYFLGLVRDGLLKPEKSDFKKVSYHDPCIWARVANKTAEPRETLENIPGLVLQEPFTSGEATRCCGGGSMFQLTFPATAAAVAGRRLAEFSDTTPIVTACPFCREGLSQEGRPVLELVELLAHSCGYHLSTH
jgi:Fe-S oxidoreductase